MSLLRIILNAAAVTMGLVETILFFKNEYLFDQKYLFLARWWGVNSRHDRH